MVTIKRGDLFEAKEKIIAHQVNCFGIAGGLAAAVFAKYPKVQREYEKRVNRSAPWGLLGTAQLTKIQRDGHLVVNLFGQYQPGEDYRPESLRMALESLAGQAAALGYSVALPYKLSCGICGGDWDEVLGIIHRTMKDVDCVIYQREGDE